MTIEVPHTKIQDDYLDEQINPWIESSLNAKAYFEAFRGQCRLRIDYAGLQEEKAWRPVDWKPHEWCKKKAEFWVRSGEYWKRKLEESFQREKD